MVKPTPTIKNVKQTPPPGSRRDTSRGSGYLSPMTDKLARQTRSRSKSESDKKGTIVNSTFSTSPANTSLLQVSLRNRTAGISPGLSPKTTTTSSTSDDVFECTETKESSAKAKPKKSQCPCLGNSGGKSWQITCSECKQVWHTRCANLRGCDLLEKAVVDVVLDKWSCPWCYSCPYPRPKTHKSEKLASALESTSRANEISASVIESLEGMLKVKLAEAVKPSNDLVESIQKQLSTLTDQMNLMRSSGPPHPLPTPPPHPASQMFPNQTQHSKPQVKIGDTTLSHTTKHIEGIVDEFLTLQEEKDLIDFFEGENFVEEGNRWTIQYGEYYRYMGSKTKPRPMPEIVTNLMTRLNENYASASPHKHLRYELNSCLVNQYTDGTDSLPEHADDEGDINQISSIFTVSLGSPRTVKFRDVASDGVTELVCPGRSMYHMTKHSQSFFKHSIDHEEPSAQVGIRYSLTFRAIHWSNFNSTILLGDSNFGKVHFGEGRGKMGQATPGLRTFAPTVEEIDPLSCVGFRNVVAMVGTNNLKLDRMDDNGIQELYQKYKTKLAQIRRYNPRCKLIVCTVLPTRSHKINRKINIFNRLLHDDLSQCTSLKVMIVDSFNTFLDRSTNLLKSRLASSEVGDILHIEGRGVGTLVRLIKNCIFTSRDQHRLVGSRLYANTLRGPPAPW